MNKILLNFFNLSERQLGQCNKLYQLLAASPVNVTSIKSEQDYYYKHVLDSIYYFKDKHLSGTVADVGAGGGFPGLALAIKFPECKVTLIDSIAKKCNFMINAAAELELKNVSVINSRAENIKNKTFDMITARGVGTVKEVLRYTENLSHSKTVWLMYKGEKLAYELDEAKTIFQKRGLKSETLRVEEPFTRSYLYIYR